MNKEYLYKIEHTQNRIRINPENCMKIIYHTVKSKRIYTIGKRFPLTISLIQFKCTGISEAQYP